jgi:hypothetical protein
VTDTKTRSPAGLTTPAPGRGSSSISLGSRISGPCSKSNEEVMIEVGFMDWDRSPSCRRISSAAIVIGGRPYICL